TGIDPVAAGMVASLAHPGGNLTGISNLSEELSGKRLELLKEAVPALARVAVLWNSANPDKAREVQATHLAAQALGMELLSLEVREGNEVASAFDSARRWRAEGLVVLFDGLTNINQTEIVALATKGQLPSVFPLRVFVDAGGLMAYGA